MFLRRHRTGGLAAAQTLRRVRLWLCAHGPQGAGLAVGRCRVIRREFRIPRKPRALAVYRGDAGGETADGGGELSAIGRSQQSFPLKMLFQESDVSTVRAEADIE